MPTTPTGRPAPFVSNDPDQHGGPASRAERLARREAILLAYDAGPHTPERLRLAQNELRHLDGLDLPHDAWLSRPSNA